ncbi:MFS general substrate transporter [Aspergillus egyptiacus]|nr:MFS general substrate transporter [Aspergillus egyptiacus]
MRFLMADAPGSKWRSSKALIFSTICIALLTETLLYGFVVPILPYMLEVRLHADPAQTQRLTTALLSIHGFVSLVSAPIIAHFADKSANRKIPLLLSLAGCLVGTILVASTPGYWALYLGRILQGVAGSAAWIVCQAMLTEIAGEDNIGKMMGLSISFITAGTLSGPMMAGTLLEWFGYWPAWSVPVAALTLDILGRLIIIEPRQLSHGPRNPPERPAEATSREDSESTHSTESSPLLSTVGNRAPEPTESDMAEETASHTFYQKMLSDPRVLTGVGNVIIFSSIMTGFNTTWPVHLRRIFGWGPSPVGLLFFIRQAPGVLLSPVSGWVRDRLGLRYPTAIAWATLALLVLFLGVPGDQHFPWNWASDQRSGKAIFITCVAGIGVVSPFVRGVGFLQIIAVVNELESKNPTIFGAHGGRSRALAMGEIGFNLGLIVGPLLAGPLSEAIGYFYLSITLVIAFMFAIVSFVFLDDGEPARNHVPSE